MTTTIKPDAMPEPDTLIDFGPDGLLAAMFYYAAESCDYRDIAHEYGFDIIIFAPLLDEALMKRHEADENILGDWRPTPPEGWKIGGTYDTEDGPHAIFLRSHAAAVEAAE